MNAFKSILLIFVGMSFLLSSASYAGDWKLYADVDGIRLEYKYADCNLEKGYDQQWVLLKLTNTSGVAKIVKWKNNLWYNNDCKTCGLTSQEYNRQLSVNAGETLEGTCSVYGDGRLNIFVKFIDEDYQNENIQVLTKFELDNITVISTD